MREEGLPYAGGSSAKEPSVHVFVCAGVAEVLQGHEAVMHEKIKCVCAATPEHS